MCSYSCTIVVNLVIYSKSCIDEMMIQIQVERILGSFLLFIETFLDLDNGQVQPHLQVLRQCPGYDLKWV